MFSDADLEFYLSNKLLLQQSSRTGGSLRKKGKYAGLRNQGATCYLNSLMQSFFHDQDVVRLILEEPAQEGSHIIKALQKLFGGMICTSTNSVDTMSLLAAFGWSKSQMFEQHDVQEFFSVLLDSISKESNRIKASIAELFQGNLADSLLCSSCGNCSKNEAPFLNVSVDVPDSLEQSSSSVKGSGLLTDLIRNQLQPEILEDDNKWLCDKCNQRVAATKSQEYLQLPKILTIHLKRFRFDPTTKRRRKLCTPIYFPETLQAGDIFTRQGTKHSFGSYELTGIIVHTGTAMGGHYHSYVRTNLADNSTSSKEDGKGVTSNVWIDCNDESVTELTEDDIAYLFRTPNTNTTTSTTNKSSLVHENAYMLVYKSVDSLEKTLHARVGNDAVSPLQALRAVVPTAVATDIRTENESHAVLLRLQEISTHIVELSVRLYTNNSSSNSSALPTVQLTLLKTATLLSALTKCHSEFVARKLLDGAVYPLSQCRLRRFLRNGTQLGGTFGDCVAGGVGEELSLEDIGFSAGAVAATVLAFEVRTAAEPAFKEFSVNDMYLSLRVWQQQQQSGSEASNNNNTTTVEVLVPGRELATVGSLRAVVSKQLAVAPAQLHLIHDSEEYPLALLSNDDCELVKDHHVFPGSVIVVEITTELTATSKAFEELSKKRKSAVIYFNNPLLSVNSNNSNNNDSTSAAAIEYEYNLSLQVALDQPLSEVKALIAKRLASKDAASITGPQCFHCKRSANAPQLRDESKTLQELALANHGILHLQMGKGCQAGEHMVRFELEVLLLDNNNTEATTATTSSNAQQQYILLGEVAIAEKSTVLQVKQLLCTQWNTFQGSSGSAHTVPKPNTPHHIRLRDGKGGKASTSGPLRDDRLVGRCLLGLADGRRVVVQVLPHDEHIGADDIVISVRVASYENKTLSLPTDVPIARTSTVKQLYQQLLKQFPQLNEPLPAAAVSTTDGSALDYHPDVSETRVLSVAKGFTSGPALTLKTALKLKWDDPAILAAAANTTRPGSAGTGPESSGSSSNGMLIDRPPLNLRDGSVIVVRSKADYYRAQVLMKAKKEAAATNDNGQPATISAGGGSAAVRAKKAQLKARLAAQAAEAATSSGEVFICGDGSSNNASSSADVVVISASAMGTRGGQGISRFGSSGSKEKSLRIISTGSNSNNSGGDGVPSPERPPAPAVAIGDGSKSAAAVLAAAAGGIHAPSATDEDALEHSMEDLPPPVA